MPKMCFDRTRDHWQGGIQAPVELVQYGDFQSADCAAVFPDIKLLLETLGNQIRFLYLHFPLHRIHPLALDAAIASEAAAAQGRFWAMHDHIFENQANLTPTSFSVFASGMGLDMVQFANDTRRKGVFYKVISDFELGKRIGVDRPPTFFVNGHRYNGSANFEGLYRTCKHVYNNRTSAN